MTSSLNTPPDDDQIIEHNGHIIKGTTKRTIIKMLKERRADGYTAKEVCEALDLDHGTVSGALSTLHLMDVLALLTEKRDRYRVYVLAEHVEGRPTKRRKKP